MPENGVHMISLETATLLTLLGFILGFFGNLLAMRKMFVANKDFEAFKEHMSGNCKLQKDHCTNCTEIVIGNIEDKLLDLKTDMKELQQCSAKTFTNLQALIASLGKACTLP